MTKEILCRDKLGNEVRVAADKLEWRVSVCGILFSADGKILFTQDDTTKEWELPGGGIEPDESVEAALQREYKEETSLEVEVGSTVGFAQDFYYHRRDQKCYKTLRLCYLVACDHVSDLPEGVQFIDPQADMPIKAMSVELIRQLAS